MYRGTTPVHTFTIPFPPEYIANIYVTYSQFEETVVEKSINGVVIEPVEDDEEKANVVVTLSQSDTLKFEEGIATIQLRVYDINGAAYASDYMRERVKPILKEGVIGA